MQVNVCVMCRTMQKRESLWPAEVTPKCKQCKNNILSYLW